MGGLTTIGDRVRVNRSERAWTQEDLAAKAGISLASVQRTERGRPVSADTVASLAAAFGIDAVELIDPDVRDGQPYLPLRMITTGRELLAVIAAGERLDFDFAELEDLDQARLIERLADFCQPLGPSRIPAGPVARVEQELEAKALLRDMAAGSLVVTGGIFSLDACEVDDDCGTGMAVLMARWSDTCAVIRVGTERAMVDRAYVHDRLGQWETPTGGAVVYPGQPELIDDL